MTTDRTTAALEVATAAVDGYRTMLIASLGFLRDGVASKATENLEQLAVADNARGFAEGYFAAIDTFEQILGFPVGRGDFRVVER